MKKLNHIWIFSDSIKGHEIQSQALASKLANNVSLFHCSLRQPWLSFAPKILPRFGKNIIWENQKPDLNHCPDAIITCGRRMAAIGKYYKKLSNSKHVQILNPGDNHHNYDVMVCPEHDGLSGDNIINSKGSLHQISTAWLAKKKSDCQKHQKITNNKIISLFIGNPTTMFFKQLEDLSTKITHNYPDYDLLICGSRRTAKKYRKNIKQCFNQAKLCWLSESDGKNPYKCLLASSDVFLVTADSINMISEACATNSIVIAIAQQKISLKHKCFIQSISKRLSTFGTTHSNPMPLDTITHVAQQVILKL